MERRKFLIGAGSTAIGASALVGTGAFSSVTSTREMSVRAVNDANAYLGLKEVPDSPNSSYVDEDEGHLRIRMDEDNETEGGGTGVNSNSVTIFKDLFRIRNQGKQTIHVFVFLVGPKTGNVGLFNGGTTSPLWATTLEVGEYEDVGLLTNTFGVDSSDPAQLVNDMIIVAVGEDNPEGGDHEAAARDLAPDDAEANKEVPDDELNE
ncbi:DUF1102 domain-containing protein [Natronococcus occultus]|nr:DUF1102 domain-containing protein [Natronococcus occultus]